MEVMGERMEAGEEIETRGGGLLPRGGGEEDKQGGWEEQEEAVALSMLPGEGLARALGAEAHRWERACPCSGRRHPEPA